MNYDKAYHYLIQKLQEELNESITYHRVNHTKKVIESAIIIALAEKITADELTLLKTAALFHDAGFLVSIADHETHSCTLAQQYLPEFHYSTLQIATICSLIVATKIPQSPYDQLSNILCDADLYYLGEDEYTCEAENLYQELLTNKKIGTKKDWLQVQINFLKSHNYFTSTAKKNCDQGKSINLNGLLSVNAEN